MAGPKWYNQRTGSVLTAARREEKSGFGKTQGDLAGSLQLCIWRRAEDPGKMTYLLVGGGKNKRGFTALENPLWFERGPPYYVNDHPVLKYLGKKIANFLHDYHRDWFPGLGLPPSNGKHNQLSPFHIKKLLRRLQKSQDTREERPEICVYSRLEIGHKDYSGRQFVYCKLFKEFHDDLRMDYVFFVPPPPFYTGRKRDFEVDLNTCWYGRVVLLFRIKVRSDSGQIWECDCAMIDVLFDLKPARCKGIT
jgi:hypothetical protein